MRVDNLFFAYDKNDIIKGISFEIKDNKITTLMGANGCGKSTLFTHGIAAGFIMYALVKVIKGEAKEVHLVNISRHSPR